MTSEHDDGKRGATAGQRPARQREKPQQIAAELRRLIVAGELEDGAWLGNERELIERFGVSRPSLREALRILEADGLVSIQRGALGGVFGRRPDHTHAARTAALVLQTRNVSLADIFEARVIIEPAAVRLVAQRRDRGASAARLRELIAGEVHAIDDPAAFGQANTRFHLELVTLAGNQTLTIVAEMLSEVVQRAVVAVSSSGPASDSLVTRRRGIRSQQRLADLIAAGDASAAAEHWHQHMRVVARVLLGQQASTVVDLVDEF